jgi:signal transduction histidine kinase
LFQESDGVIGQPLDRLFPDYADLIHDFRGSSSLRQEVEVRGRDQLTYVYDLQISPVTRPSGRQAGRLVMLRDITEQKAVEAERERLIGELESYAHSVAHDLKHPLTLIMGYADILRTAALAGDQAEIEESNQALQRGGERIARIIDDLLMLAQVRRQEDIPVEGLEMGSLVEAALGRLEATVKSRAATVTLPESWPSAVGYASWVEEVWANYLSNALKYGGDPPSLGLGGERQGEQIRYWVKDNGPGLSEAAQRRLFQQFERLDTRRASGHGLGLSIVRRIIERLGGEVGVESVEGEGSLFYFTLPAGQKVDRTR